MKIKVATHDFDTKDIDVYLEGSNLHIDIGSDKNSVDLSEIIPEVMVNQLVSGEFNINKGTLDLVNSNGSNTNTISIPLDNLLNSIQTTKGRDGINGLDGKSAYELAVKYGYIGTEQQWVNSLIGQKGDKGDSFTFEDLTEEQLQQLKGSNGLDGKSAYELAVQSGYQGTLEEWLESLKGSNVPSSTETTEKVCKPDVVITNAFGDRVLAYAYNSDSGCTVSDDDNSSMNIDIEYTKARDDKAVEEGNRGRDESKSYTDEKLRELKQNGAKVYVNGPITGDGTTNNHLGLNFNTDDFEVLADGSLTLKVKPPVSFTTFDSNYKLGFHTFTGSSKYNGSTFVRGVPLDINAEVLEQDRALTADQQVDTGYDFNGYYIASENQLDVWLSGVDGTVWKITNDVGVNADGSVKNPNAWGKWQKLDNNNSVTNEMVTRLQEQMNSNNQKDQAQDAEIEKLKQKNTAQDLKDQEQDRRLDALEALNNTLCTIDVKQVSSYTLVDTDNTVISSGGVITVPDNITIGRVFTVIQKGTAEVRIAGTGVIAPYSGTLTLAGQNAAVTVLKTDVNEVRVFGQTKSE